MFDQRNVSTFLQRIFSCFGFPPTCFLRWAFQVGLQHKSRNINAATTTSTTPTKVQQQQRRTNGNATNNPRLPQRRRALDEGPLFTTALLMKPQQDPHVDSPFTSALHDKPRNKTQNAAIHISATWLNSRALQCKTQGVVTAPHYTRGRQQSKGSPPPRATLQFKPSRPPFSSWSSNRALPTVVHPNPTPLPLRASLLRNLPWRSDLRPWQQGPEGPIRNLEGDAKT